MDDAVVTVSDASIPLTNAQLSFSLPSALPLPFTEGESVTYDAESGGGGGPNFRAAYEVRAADGSLLLSISHPLEGWTVEQGARHEPSRGSDYDTYNLDVRFEHGGASVTVGSGEWASLSTPGGEFLVWGSAAEREWHGSGSYPPGYLAGWLDFAIVRTR